jgi:hypothetical protein
MEKRGGKGWRGHAMEKKGVTPKNFDFKLIGFNLIYSSISSVSI